MQEGRAGKDRTKEKKKETRREVDRSTREVYRKQSDQYIRRRRRDGVWRGGDCTTTSCMCVYAQVLSLLSTRKSQRAAKRRSIVYTHLPLFTLHVYVYIYAHTNAHVHGSCLGWIKTLNVGGKREGIGGAMIPTRRLDFSGDLHLSEK